MIIGLTGGIGSGKTTVAKMLADRGFNIIDADALSREVVLPGSDALKELASEFGLEILNSDGSLNRKKLSDIAFASSENTAKLNRIVTGRVIELAKERMSGSCVFDAPTLFENNLQNLVDVVILVTAERDERVARVVKRDGFTRHDVLFRMARQMPEEEKIKLADIVIYNNGSIEELEHAVTDALNCDKIKR